MVRRLTWQGTGARPLSFGGLRHLTPYVSNVVLRPKAQFILYFTRFVSLLRPRSVNSLGHQGDTWVTAQGHNVT
jgi:hypothetical protein